MRHKDPRSDAVLALLFAWVLAAGGWIDGMTAVLPAAAASVCGAGAASDAAAVRDRDPGPLP